jgi:hypothetical protein
VRKWCLYIPFAVFFLSTTSLSQLFKLPVLVAHYMEHQQLDRSISILDFLSMHYWGQDSDDNDQDRDMQLPFKTIEQNSNAQVVVMPSCQITIEKPLVTGNTTQPVFSDADLTKPALAGLFRPPRACSV